MLHAHKIMIIRPYCDYGYMGITYYNPGWLFVLDPLTVGMPVVGPLRCKTNGIDDHDKT